MSTNEAVERLRGADCWVCGLEVDPDDECTVHFECVSKDALADERRATVKRIRAKVQEGRVENGWDYTPPWLRRILDEEAAR